MERNNNIFVPELLDSISKIIVDARKRAVQTINNELIVTYWKIGKEIVEKEQINNIDHQTSRQIILQLSKQLTESLGNGFSRSNLLNMRKLYIEFPNVQTLSGHLSWSHICELIVMDNNEDIIKEPRKSLRCDFYFLTQRRKDFYAKDARIVRQETIPLRSLRKPLRLCVKTIDINFYNFQQKTQ